MQSVTGSVIANNFRCNSLFDPDASIGGHQPLYFDTYNAIYDQYAVISSHLKITFQNSNTASTYLIGIVVDDDTATSTTIDTLMEQNHGVHQVLTPLAGSKSIHTFSVAWECERVLGINPFASQTYKTAVSANPTEQSIWSCYASDLSGNTSFINWKVEIVYDTLFTELKTPVQS